MVADCQSNIVYTLIFDPALPDGLGDAVTKIESVTDPTTTVTITASAYASVYDALDGVTTTVTIQAFDADSN
jgi:hypothetical protein